MTPSGAGAVGVIRVFGPEAVSIVQGLFQPASSHNQTGRASEHGRLRYGTLVDDGETIDDVLVTTLSAARWTVVEISAHGGVRVLERILQSLADRGAPLADPAAHADIVWNARNLIEEEALTALVTASTARAVRFLSWQRMHLVDALNETADEFEAGCATAAGKLRGMVDRAAAARLLVEGARVAIVGMPNSGKSTLFNRLVGRTAAVVTDRAGTTRDWVDASIELDGIPITLVDTAGHQEAAGSVERRAIHAGWAIGKAADLVLLAIDSSCSLTSEGHRLAGDVARLGSSLVVSTKADLGPEGSPSHDSSAVDWPGSESRVRVSAITGEGMGELRTLIARGLGIGPNAEEAPCFFTGRQVDVARSILSRSPGQVDAALEIRNKLIDARSATTNKGKAL